MTLPRIIVDRPFKDALVAVGVTSLLFAFALYLEDHISNVLFGGAIGLAVVTVGFAVTSRSRPIPQTDPRQSYIRVVAAAGAGVGLGLLNLGANRALAFLDPRVHALLVERFGKLSPWGPTLAAPIIEEVMLRLLSLGALAWIAGYVVRDPRNQFATALWVSSFAFGLLHIFRPVPGVWLLDQLYLGGVVLKSALAGVLLGWIFWRWGLPHAILCHALANATHRLCEQLLF